MTAQNTTLSKPFFLGLALLIFIGYIVAVGLVHLDGRDAALRGEPPLFTDYTSLYAASLMIHREPVENLYDGKKMLAAEHEAGRAMYDFPLTDVQAKHAGYAPWHYPPIFILFCIPLALFSYFVSYLVWMIGGLVPYLFAIRAITAERFAWPMALAAPPVFFNMMFGQTGFYTAGFIGLGLALVASSPILAGVVIGLASFKPHFGLLLPIALAAGGFWRVFVSASVTVMALIVTTLVAYGPDPWRALISGTGETFRGFYYNAYDLTVMISPYSTAKLAGASVDAAWMVQGFFSAAAIAVVIYTWKRRDNSLNLIGLRSAVLCCATLLAVPMAYAYDLALLVPAAAWLYRDMKERGWQFWEGVAAVSAIGGTLLIKDLAEITGIQIGPVLVLGLLLICLRRLALTQGPSSQSGTGYLIRRGHVYR